MAICLRGLFLQKWVMVFWFSPGVEIQERKSEDSDWEVVDFGTGPKLEGQIEGEIGKGPRPRRAECTTGQWLAPLAASLPGSRAITFAPVRSPQIFS